MRLLLIIVLLLAGFVVFVRVIEKRVVFYPTREVTATPAMIGVPDFREVSFLSKDGLKLHGWFVPCAGATFTVLFFHGNAGNISHRLEKIRILHELGLAVFIIDYRGYGKSEGKPTEAGLYQDAEAAYDHLTGDLGVPAGSLVVYGESLGGAAAVHVAATRKCAGLVTEGTFTSARDMAKSMGFIPRFLLSLRLDSLSKIHKVSAPKLILHSVGDEIIPYAMGERLYAAALSPKTFLKLIGGHNTCFIDSGEAYRDGLREFISSLKVQSKTSLTPVTAVQRS